MCQMHFQDYIYIYIKQHAERQLAFGLTEGHLTNEDTKKKIQASELEWKFAMR